MSRKIGTTDSYREVLVKLIPSEIIAALIAIKSICNSQSPDPGDGVILFWAFVILVLLTPFYLWLFYETRKPDQIACTIISLLVWAYSLGGIVVISAKHDAKVSAATLVLWTTASPLLLKRRKQFYKWDTVAIASKRQSDIAKPEFHLEWSARMSEFCGMESVIRSVDFDRMTVRLSVDKGANEWAFEWISLKN